MKKVIVIGAGVAGLTAAICCLEKGMSVEVFEKSSVCGGNLTGWDRKGCRIDNCLHWLTGTNENSGLYGIWQKTGMLNGDDLIRLPYFYRSEKDNSSVSFYRDLDEAQKSFIAASPEDRRETEKFFSAVRLAANGLQHRKLSAAETVKGAVNFARYSRTDLKSLSRRFRSPLLSSAFCDMISGGFNTLGLVLSYAAFVSGNGDIPKGGSVAAAERMANEVRKRGGVIHLNNAVRKIAVSIDRATGIIDRNGEFFPADAVISACDTAVTFSHLLDKRFCPYKLKRLYKDPRYPVFSAVSAAYAVDSGAVDFVGTTAFDCKPFYTDGERQTRLMVRSYGYEPSYAPTGKTVLQCMIVQSEAAAEKWIRLKASGDEYYVQKETVSEMIKRRIAEHLNITEDLITSLDIWTPASYNSRFSAYKGAFMSYAVTKSSFMPKVGERVPGLRNVILASQWLSPVGGVPNAARSGVKAAETACKLSGAKAERKAEGFTLSLDGRNEAL